MELALLTTALGELYKAVARKIGSERAKKLVYVATFVFSFLFVLAQNHGFVTQESLAHWVQTYFAAVGIYEIVVKRLVYPTLNIQR